MVYGRNVKGKTLTLEPSGALKDSALVMRDEETDSWWWIMEDEAIGGPMEGTELPKIPAGEKVTWGDWVARHPDTKVLSVDGIEHLENNPYDNYFASERTFRGAEVEDGRLAPKAPIYTFRHRGTPYALPHAVAEGGARFEVGESDLFFYRPEGAAVFASTEAWRLPAGAAEGASPGELRERLTSGEVEGAERLDGFDTFWYTWVGGNPETEVLR